jgi:molybdenum cofactor guanylyltransferase
VCKGDTCLPPIGRAERWDEPDEPRHPLIGIVHALECAGQPVLVCAADMPFVTPEALGGLLAAAGGSRAARPPLAVVATGERGLEPLLGLYAPGVLPSLRGGAIGGRSARAVVERLDPLRVPLAPALLRSVNTRADLAAAERELSGRS